MGVGRGESNMKALADGMVVIFLAHLPSETALRSAGAQLLSPTESILVSTFFTGFLHPLNLCSLLWVSKQGHLVGGHTAL